MFTTGDLITQERLSRFWVLLLLLLLFIVLFWNHTLVCHFLLFSFSWVFFPSQCFSIRYLICPLPSSLTSPFPNSFVSVSVYTVFVIPHVFVTLLCDVLSHPGMFLVSLVRHSFVLCLWCTLFSFLLLWLLFFWSIFFFFSGSLCFICTSALVDTSHFLFPYFLPPACVTVLWVLINFYP